MFIEKPSASRIYDEFEFAVDTLRKLCFARSDTKRLDSLITILLLSISDVRKAAADLLEFIESFERVLKSEKMEILYPFEKIKTASHEFGVGFFDGYFDWNQVSYDPYQQLGLVEKMLEDVDVAKTYVKKVIEELKSSQK
jgi:hypothetical protein